MKNARIAYAALAAVCFFWGTTYLGIRIAIETIPPLYLIAIRYTISGTILLIGARLGGFTLPSGRELRQTAICGIICIGIGNGFLAIAELLIPSGLAALFYTTAPFWMVGLDALLPQGKRPSLATVGGLCIGFAGVAFLVYPAARQEGFGGHTISGFLLLELSAVGWVLGALLQKRVQTSAQPFVNGAVQQLAAGLATFVPAALFEKLPHAVSLRSEFAVAYLVVFGSLVGFSAFIYAMTHLPVAIVSIYTFVNPVVAILLGWLFFREPFGVRELAAMLIIFSGIGVVRWSESIAERRRDLVSTRIPAA
ncbi:MAG TPA: EamA family transporter [Bryobacteraceae bacterium]|jgi:drug/metabolite transporter (DMT)-like permease|nr:EamA family transporter [Bryobacteraceae bacterium]